MEYTKGEWKAMKSPMGDWIICSPDELICREARHYNANLIAAAPDMYEALIQWLVYLDTTYPKNMIEKKHAYNLMEKALAKAEGKENELPDMQ